MEQREAEWELTAIGMEVRVVDAQASIDIVERGQWPIIVASVCALRSLVKSREENREPRTKSQEPGIERRTKAPRGYPAINGTKKSEESRIKG